MQLSHRYIPARQLPDKAVSLLDTACARVAVSQHATPAEVEDCQRRIEALRTESEIIGREEAIGIDVGERRRAHGGVDRRGETRLASCRSATRRRRRVVDRILDIGKLRADAARRGGRSRCEGHRAASSQRRCRRRSRRPARAPARAQPRRRAGLSEPTARRSSPSSRRCRTKLAALQGDAPLILPTVDEQAVASVVQDWTGIPVGRMVKNEIETVLKLADTLNQRVIGQEHALEMIAKRIQTSRAGLDNPSKPIGVFMLCGTSGVGKTETALALAEALYGGEQNVITINMSEFQEAHTVSHAQGRAAGLRRLRRRRRADRGGAPPALQRGAARRGREGPPRRARALLPGLRQGLDGRRRRPRHRLQEHDHPADDATSAPT